MRWISGVLGAVLLAAVAAQPAGAVVVDMLVISTLGNPVPGFTFVSNWPDGHTTVNTTDATGRLNGDVPKGGHFCSVWLEALHIASGMCNFTDDTSSRTTAPSTQTTENPPPTDAERAAKAALDTREGGIVEVRAISPQAVFVILLTGDPDVLAEVDGGGD